MTSNHLLYTIISDQTKINDIDTALFGNISVARRSVSVLTFENSAKNLKTHKHARTQCTHQMTLRICDRWLLLLLLLT